jgi:uncharacterized protein YjbI with pentapeptide repeats
MEREEALRLLWEWEDTSGEKTISDFRGVDLSEANLRGVVLHKVVPNKLDPFSVGVKYRVNLSGANLREADLSGVKRLTQLQIDSAVGDRDTDLPPELSRPDDWR